MKYLLLILLISSFVAAECDGDQIDINSASMEELDEIIGIGEKTAKKIIDGRPYEKLEDLDKVSGIGEIKLGNIIDEGLACIEEEEEEEEKIVFEEKEESIKEIVLEEENENEIIILGENVEDKEELIYVSKNAKIGDYLPYGFAAFLILIIGSLIWRR